MMDTQPKVDIVATSKETIKIKIDFTKLIPKFNKTK